MITSVLTAREGTHESAHHSVHPLRSVNHGNDSDSSSRTRQTTINGVPATTNSPDLSLPGLPRWPVKMPLAHASGRPTPLRSPRFGRPALLALLPAFPHHLRKPLEQVRRIVWPRGRLRA